MTTMTVWECFCNAYGGFWMETEWVNRGNGYFIWNVHYHPFTRKEEEG